MSLKTLRALPVPGSPLTRGSGAYFRSKAPSSPLFLTLKPPVASSGHIRMPKKPLVDSLRALKRAHDYTATPKRRATPNPQCRAARNSQRRPNPLFEPLPPAAFVAAAAAERISATARTTARS